MLVHVALDLHAEELRREHQAGLAVPVADAVVGRHRIERAAWVLVEPDRHDDLGRAGAERVVRADQRAPAGGAAVGDVDERHAGEAEVRHERVGGAGRRRAAEGVLDVGPRDPGVGEGAPRRDRALLAPADRVAAERVHADPDDGDVTH